MTGFNFSAVLGVFLGQYSLTLSLHLSLVRGIVLCEIVCWKDITYNMSLSRDCRVSEERLYI